MLPKFTVDCNELWPDTAVDSARCMGLCAQHVSFNNACKSTVCKWFRRNSGHQTFQIWTHCSYHVWGVMHKAFMKASSEAKNSFWINKSHSKNVGKFSAE